MNLRFPGWLLLPLVLASCATPKSAPIAYTPPSAGAVRHEITAAAVAVTAAKSHVQAAQASLGAAQEEAKALAAAVPADLLAQVQALQFRLSAADVQLRDAAGQAAAAETALQASAQHAAALQAEIEVQTSQLNAEATQKNAALAQLSQAEAAARLQTRLAWKWRLLALAEVLLAAGFFVARQYLPFLKLI